MRGFRIRSGGSLQVVIGKREAKPSGMIHIDTVAAAAAAAYVDVHIIIIIIIHFALCCIGECEIRKRDEREKEEGCLFLWK